MGKPSSGLLGKKIKGIVVHLACTEIVESPGKALLHHLLLCLSLHYVRFVSYGLDIRHKLYGHF